MAVVTPLTQATVNNNFERYNKTSLYEEDLRINYVYPLQIGASFSNHHVAVWVCQSGLCLLTPLVCYLRAIHCWVCISLQKFGASDKVAVLLSFGLYFTGFSQFWWNEKGPLVALFPWVIIPFS
ncbi:hypothetical protein [Comamonas sp. JC664]|uniref:hypothetical protein n=1 Tax=Comamonas sp. JC664 TaxID=2801917 RepID=UPI00360EFA2B